MRKEDAYLALFIGLGGLGAVPTAIVAGSVSAESARIDAAIMIGGEEDLDACSSTGEVTGLDPSGDGFLSVRSGPGGRPYREIDRLFNGNRAAKNR
jgi:hypothetical protein